MPSDAISTLRIVLANSTVAEYPEGGGHFTCFLQHFLGLRALGHDVYWLELITSRGDEDAALVTLFFERMREWGLDDRTVVVVAPRGQDQVHLDNATIHGRSDASLRDLIATADLLWNYSCSVHQPLLGLFKRRVLVDIDPGQLQVTAMLDNEQLEHEVFLSVGSNIGNSDCKIPTLGVEWHAFAPPVYLPMWSPQPDTGVAAPFTSVTQWNWSEWPDAGNVLSASKREAYLRYLELPRLVGRPMELAANFGPDDTTGDQELLLANGWNLVHPHEIAGTPTDYRSYIYGSRAEFLCPKPIFRLLRTGWISDRSACYLASGRPVLTEDTGIDERRFPTGSGLLTFRSLQEAADCVAEIDSNYAHHSHAARAFAEEFLASDRSLNAMLAACF